MTARAAGLAQVRSRCRLTDRWGNTSRLLLITEFLAVERDAVVLCGPGGRPVRLVRDAAWAVAGAGKVLHDGEAGAAIVLPPGAEAAGKARKLERMDGELWIVPVR